MMILNEQTNRLSDDGTQLLLNGSPLVGGGSGVTNYFNTVIITNLTVENLNVTTNITQTLIVTNITVENTTVFKGKVTIQKGVENYQGVLTHAGTVTLDFDPAQLTTKSISLTGDITFAFTNLATNRNYRVLLQNTQATNCTITWPSGVHGYYSTIISNNTWGMAALEAWGSVDTNVWVSTSNDGTYTP